MVDNKALAPVPLLRELRQVFEIDAVAYRKQAQESLSASEQKALDGKAYANEYVVKKIDATLRDWA